jgi:hypothetical protein
MKDPAAWSPRDLSELEQRMLEAARYDRIPPELSARMAQGVAAAAAGSLQPSAAEPPGPLQPRAACPAGSPPRATLLFSKAKLWGSLTVALLAGAAGWAALRSDGAVAARQQTPALAERSTPQLDAERLSARAPVDSSPAPDARSGLAAPAAAKTLARGGARPDAPSLQEELRLLDRARTALLEGEGQRALGLLDSHARRFSRAALGPEADVLRVEALVATGSEQRATALAQRFLRNHPAHPLAEHMASLIARP